VLNFDSAFLKRGSTPKNTQTLLGSKYSDILTHKVRDTFLYSAKAELIQFL